jgi:hypothetical protein
VQLHYTTRAHSHVVSRAQANALKHAEHILGENLRDAALKEKIAATKQQQQQQLQQQLQQQQQPKRIPVDAELQRRRRQEDFVAVGKPNVLKYLQEEVNGRTNGYSTVIRMISISLIAWSSMLGVLVLCPHCCRPV